MSDETPPRRPRLRRDSQQWEFDRTVRDTGRVYHFQPPGRGFLPPSVRMHAMISKHLGQQAQRLERLADAEAAAGHDLTALELYYDASVRYAQAQHPIFVNNDEKRLLHGASIRCYDAVRRLSPTTIEHLDIPWGSRVISGNLHLAPVEGPAPLIFFIPGCDMTKEMVPHPLQNWATMRGMHLFVFDGPGQGESNLRDIAVTVDNYEDAASTALTSLLERPDVDSDRVGLYAMSFGSYWGARVAGSDDRFAATVLQWASVCDKYYLFEEESPRYKQLFSYLTRSKSEEELDAFIAQMGLEPFVGEISSPTLMTIGEYDPRSPLDEVYEFFDALRVPSELWVFADQHHLLTLRGAAPPSAPAADSHSLGMDWLRDRFDGRPLTQDRAVRYLEPNGVSPNDPDVPLKRHWYE